jgi:hypothetical protein
MIGVLGTSGPDSIRSPQKFPNRLAGRQARPRPYPQLPSIDGWFIARAVSITIRLFGFDDILAPVSEKAIFKTASRIFLRRLL